MDCKRTQKQIVAYVDHPEQVSLEVREHLKDCPNCQEEVASIQRMIRLMGKHKTSMNTTESLRTIIKQAVHEKFDETAGWDHIKTPSRTFTSWAQSHTGEIHSSF